MNRKMMRAALAWRCWRCLQPVAMPAARARSGACWWPRSSKAPPGNPAAMPPPSPPDPQAMAAEALLGQSRPLILVGLERMNTTQVMAMTGENAGQRTYMTKNEQAL